MLADGALWKHFSETDKQAEETLSRLVDDIVLAEGITEELKSTDQIAWVRKNKPNRKFFSRYS